MSKENRKRKHLQDVINRQNAFKHTKTSVKNGMFTETSFYDNGILSGIMISKTTPDTTFRMVGRFDVRDELELTDEEMNKIVESKVNFNFWWKGKDHRTGLKYTFDGDDVYADFSLRNFFLANICDKYKGAKMLGNHFVPELIRNIKGLSKWLNFEDRRLTIKELGNEYVWEW